MRLRVSVRVPTPFAVSCSHVAVHCRVLREVFLVSGALRGVTYAEGPRLPALRA